jgi:hypothetical protein
MRSPYCYFCFTLGLIGRYDSRKARLEEPSSSAVAHIVALKCKLNRRLDKSVSRQLETAAVAQHSCQSGHSQVDYKLEAHSQVGHGALARNRIVAKVGTNRQLTLDVIVGPAVGTRAAADKQAAGILVAGKQAADKLALGYSNALVAAHKQVADYDDYASPRKNVRFLECTVGADYNRPLRCQRQSLR